MNCVHKNNLAEYCLLNSYLFFCYNFTTDIIILYQVYVYKRNDGNRVTADVTATNILANNLVEVNDFDVNSDATASLTFYGYLCQSAGFADAAAAFAECF